MKASWSSIFEEPNGGYSSMRVMFVMTCVIVMFIWAYVCVSNSPPKLVEIPKEIVALILGFGGVKTFQRFAENTTITETEIKK